MYTQNWNAEFIKNTAFIERNSIKIAVEIGCFEGLTSTFIAKNLLNHDYRLICIDPLEDDYALDGDGNLFKGQYDRFCENVQPVRDNVILYREPSNTALPKLKNDSVEFIYVDGDHTQPSVYFDGMESFRICKVGGYILFDDYNWGNDGAMKRGIDQVLAENPNHRLLLKLNQVLVQKLPPSSPTEDGQDEYQNASIEKLFNGDTIHAAYANLDIRTDRNDKMIAELNRVGIQMERQRSFPWREIWDNADEETMNKIRYMHDIRKTPGAIGCWYSQMEIMKKALEQNKHAWVNEDDLVFCDDIQDRLKIIYKFLNQHEWDVFWFGGTYHIEPTWHKSIEGKHVHKNMEECKCNLNRDWEPTFNPQIVRTYGAFSTHSYLVNKDRIKHILELLNRDMHKSMGIDFAFIVQQPNLNCFAFNPGCVKQFDSMSNISNAFARQSGFANLGPHWFKQKL